jgi:hypothetical protein
MERSVPKIASEEVVLYTRTYYSLLRSSGETRINSLVETHTRMNSLLHPDAGKETIDMSAFVYSLLRLPSEILKSSRIIMGQSPGTFLNNGFGDFKNWKIVSAAARRRRCLYNGDDILALLIASRSDIDDIIPQITALQIEWNKFHLLMRNLPRDFKFESLEDNKELIDEIGFILKLSSDDISRLMTIWGRNFAEQMQEIRTRELDLRIRLLDGSLIEYRRAIHEWWEQIRSIQNDITARPVYFISSNAHSLINILSGYAHEIEDKLISFVESSDDPLLVNEWWNIQQNNVPSSKENFLYYAMKKYLSHPDHFHEMQDRIQKEKDNGIVRVKNAQSFDLEAQIMPLSEIDYDNIDPRLKENGIEELEKSNAIILNIDYPLGMAAYHVLSQVASQAGQILGIYILGKAAILNGIVGDVMIPNVVYDGQSENTYLFANCFDSNDITPYLVYGSVLDSQKAVTVLGTFLQNHEFMDIFYSEGYTDIEMEAGPYLSAFFEMHRPRRYPVNEIVNLTKSPIDFGMLHYASDKPLSKGTNLGAASLSYFGMDPTYATSIAILKRIFAQEKIRLSNLE